jgi:quinol monooxygenase YgiN
MISPPVRLTVQWLVRPQQGRGVLSALQTLMTRTRHQAGCLSCSIETDLGDYVTVRLREQWETEEDLKRHVRSDQFVALAGLLESASEAPTMRFELPAGTRGLDWAQEIRQEATT